MNGALAIFVKTPGYSSIKTRLAKRIGNDKALEFYRLAVKATEQVVKQTASYPGVSLTSFYTCAEFDALDDPLWRGLKTMHTGEGELGTRLHHVYSQLLNRYDYVILIGADSPQLQPQHLRKTIDMLAQSNHFIIGPSTDGGFYCFAGTQSVDQQTWEQVHYSQSTTAQQLIQLLKQQQHIIYQLPPLTDVDEADDLKRLADELTTPLLPAQVELNHCLKTMLLC